MANARECAQMRHEGTRGAHSCVRRAEGVEEAPKGPARERARHLGTLELPLAVILKVSTLLTLSSNPGSPHLSKSSCHKGSVLQKQRVVV